MAATQISGGLRALSSNRPMLGATAALAPAGMEVEVIIRSVHAAVRVTGLRERANG